MSELLQNHQENNNNDQTNISIESQLNQSTKTSANCESTEKITNMIITNSDLDMTIVDEEKNYIMNGIACEKLNGSAHDKENSSQNNLLLGVEGNKSNKYLGKFRCLKDSEMPELITTESTNHSDEIHATANGVAELSLNGDVNLDSSALPSDENSKQSEDAKTKSRHKKKKKKNSENGIETRRRSARLRKANKESPESSNSDEKILSDEGTSEKHKSKKDKSKSKSKHKDKEKSKSKKSKHEKTKKEKNNSTPNNSLPSSSNTQADTQLVVEVMPEKVKSRWRRNSEMDQGLENGHLANDNVASGNQDATPGDISLSITPSSTPMPEFQVIDENLFLFERKKDELKKKLKEAKKMICDCLLTKEERSRGLVGCGDDCLNRMLMIECGSRCPLGDHCSNKRFQQKSYAPVEPFKTAKKGWGLRTLKELPADTFIMEYVGEVIDPFMFHKRVEKYAKQKVEHYYFMALKSDEIIDATIKGNVTRFINHSCEPNSITQKWTVNGELRIGFFTIKQVNPGEEITFDYQFQRYGKKAQRCFCESSNCRGWIGSTENADILTDGSKISKGQTNEDEGEEDYEEYDSEDELNPDASLEEEIDYLLHKGGLCNRQEIILTTRLMVQAEKCHLRLKLIDVLMSTFVMAYLRLFLDYHGLKLIWIWMMEAEDTELKARILQLLEVLPIPNKTMLTDSKVYQVVEKWAQKESPESQQFLNLNDEPNKDKTDEAKSVIEKPNTESDKPSEVTGNTSIDDTFNSQKELLDLNQDKQIGKSDEDSSDRKVELNKLSGKVVIKSKTKTTEVAQITPTKSREKVSIGFLAQKLLVHWKDLKEVFRIPRLERQKRHDDEAEADRKTKENEERVSKGLSVIQENRVIDNKDYTIAGILGNKRRCLKSLTESDPRTYRVAPQAIQNVQKLSKEEHRKMFEYNVAKNDYNEALKKYQEDLALYNEYKEHLLQQFQLRTVNNNAENQGSLNEFLSQFANDPTANRLLEGYLYPSVLNSNNSAGYIDQSNGSALGDSLIDPSLESAHMSPDHPMCNEVDLADLVPRYESPLVVLTNHAPDPNSNNAATHGIDNVDFSEIIFEDDTFLDSMERKMFEEMYPSEGIYYITQKGKTYFISLTGNITDEITVKENVTEPLPISFTERIPEEKLPYPWKYATHNGQVYYYNKLKHITQWHPPQESQIDEFDDPRLDSFDMIQSDMSQPSTSSSPFILSAHKKEKDKVFRAKLSQFVVKCLNPYMKKGRIANNSDFKTLARKLTYTIEEKEMKQNKDLSFSDSVKHKTKEYVKRYMSTRRVHKVNSSADKTSLSPNN